MPQRRIIDIRWPTGGLDRKLTYQSQPPFTTPYAMNVRPDSVFEQRERGGSRPGVGDVFYTDFGAPTRMLASLDYVAADGLEFVEDSFQSVALGSAWETLAATGAFFPDISTLGIVAPIEWLAAKRMLPRVAGGYASANGPLVPVDPLEPIDPTTGEDARVMYDAVADFSNARDWRMSMYIVPDQQFNDCKFTFYAFCDSGLITGNGLALMLRISHGAFDSSLFRAVNTYQQGSVSPFSSNAIRNQAGQSVSIPGWFRLFWDASALTLTASYLGYQAPIYLAGESATFTSMPSGTRFGFGVRSNSTTRPTRAARIAAWRMQYDRGDNRDSFRTVLCASGGGGFYREAAPGFLGQLTTATGAANLSADNHIDAADRIGKLYIADHGPPEYSGTGAILLPPLNLLNHTSFANLPADVVPGNRHVITISSVSDPSVNGTYYWTQFAGTLMAIEPRPTNTGLIQDVVFAIHRDAKVFDPVADTLKLWRKSVTTGSLPANYPFVAVYRDRMVLATDYDWIMSRQGDPLDWDTSIVGDSQAAVPGTLSEAGALGDNIRAMVPFGDDYMLFGCRNSLWVLRGDPRIGGQIDNLSRRIGIIDRRAWAMTPDGYLVFLSYDGLYGIAPGGGEYPQSISRERLPDELLNIDPVANTVLMAYDVQYRAIHVYVTPTGVGRGGDYWFDWETKTFWYVDLQGLARPTAILEHRPRHIFDAGVYLGGNDGRIRVSSNFHELDDTEIINSSVMLGPFYLGADDRHKGIWHELVGVLAADMASGHKVRWELFTADTPEAAYDAAVAGVPIAASGSWTAGLNARELPRARGAAAILKLSSVDGKPWALERLTAVLRDTGRLRA